MPTTTEAATRCRRCRNLFTNVERSIFDGICSDCFDRDYVICAGCGQLTRATPVETRRSRNSHVGGDAYSHEGEVICYRCHDNAHRRSNYWLPKPFDVSFATYKRIGSKRKFGVEIETSQCSRRSEVYGNTKFGCKSDCSISGCEFDSPILYEDEGLAHIEDFLAFGAERRWRADSRCGCHTHYDMRDESDEQLYHIAYAYTFTARVWRRCVPRRMQDRSYCRPMHSRAADVKSAYDRGTEFRNFACGSERYVHVNFNAYNDHTTFEIRVLEGTVDPEVICPWITLHCRFIDAVRGMSFEDLRGLFRGNARSKFRSLVDLIGDADLTDWVADRARYVAERPLRGPRLQSS